MTKPLYPLAAALVAALLVPAAAHAQEPTVNPDADEIDLLEDIRKGTLNWVELTYQSYRKAKMDSTLAMQIPARELELAWGSLKLDGGYLVPIEPADIDEDEPGAAEVPKEREWIAAVYVGTGSFHWDPPNKTQQWILGEMLRDLSNKRHGKAPEYVEELDITITDGAIFMLNGKWRDLLTEGATAIELDKKMERGAKSLWKNKFVSKKAAARAQAKDMIEGAERGFLSVDMITDSIKGAPSLIYSYDPDEFEPASITTAKRYALNRDSITWTNLGLGIDPEMAATMTERDIAMAANHHSPIDVQYYDLDMTVRRDDQTNDWGMEVVGSMKLKLTKPGKSLLVAFINSGSFELDESQKTGAVAPEARPMKVQYFRDADGAPITYLHSGNALLVDLGREYQAGEEYEMKFKYSGNFIWSAKSDPPPRSLSEMENLDQGSQAIVKIITWELPPGLPWYPSNGIADRYTFDWKLRLPRPLIAATSGTLLALDKTDKHMVHVIKEEDPETFPAIVFGNFNVHENEPDYDAGEIKIRLYTLAGFDKEAKSFLEEAQSIVSYYSAMFGPYPFSELDLVQMAPFQGFAQAPAGIIRITGEVFIPKTDLVGLYDYADGELRDYFMPHEVAHEWWGHKVDFGGWPSSRDQWISETFAEYSAALYIEERDARRSGDPEDTSGYDDRSAAWRINRRGHVQSRTAPLWAGHQMGGYWTSTVYSRGPLVLDMLRQNFGKEAVLKVMAVWCELAHRNNGFALTEDFQKVLEQVIPGVAFDDFLNDFVKGNAEIPK